MQPADTMQPLVHNTGNAATGGIWRVRRADGTAVLKVSRPPATGPDMVGSPGWQTSDDPTHWNYWRRESIAYRTGFAARVYADAGIRPPVLLDSADRADGSVELWLADEPGAPGITWSPMRLAAFARQLGVAQARWINRVPDEPWLSRNWLAQYVAARHLRVPTDEQWDHPVTAAWPTAVRRTLRGLWERRAAFVAAAGRTPRTLCHLDVWPSNLIEDGADTVLLDWAFTGEGAVGEDISNLVIDSVTDGLMDAALLPEIAEGAVDGYLAGLRDAGWTGDPDAVRRAVKACGVAKYSWFGPALIARAASGTVIGHANYNRHASNEAAFANLAGLATMLADWTDGALSPR